MPVAFARNNLSWPRWCVTTKKVADLFWQTKLIPMIRLRVHQKPAQLLELDHKLHWPDLSPNGFWLSTKKNPTNIYPQGINGCPQFLKRFKRNCHRIPKKRDKFVHTLTKICRMPREQHSCWSSFTVNLTEKSQFHYYVSVDYIEEYIYGLKKILEKNHKC